MLHKIRCLALVLLMMGTLAVVGAGCSDFGAAGGCTTEARPALVVTVADATTGAPIEEATVTVVDGAYVEELDPSAGFEGQYSAAHERAGVYDIEISSDGYATLRLEDVEVTEDSCHVRTRELEVRLQRAAG
jgi:hypothetical protein